LVASRSTSSLLRKPARIVWIPCATENKVATEMLVADIADFRHLLACPVCRHPLAVEGDFVCTTTSCRRFGEPFPIIQGKPVLIDPDNSVISLDELGATQGSSPIQRPISPSLRLRHWVLGAVVEAPNYVAACQIRKLLEIMGKRDEPATRPTVLVIGGGRMGDQTEELYHASEVNVIAFDIYVSPLTQFVADAHSIPVVSESIDAVVIQAVLEHVLEPWKVVDEIHRILKDDGLVYADTPFLQPVHEGPYDFTRFTDSGHRALFKRFAIIDSGLLRGSGTTLSWCFADFVRALTRSTTLAAMTRFLTFWMSRLNRFLDHRQSLDSASSVFFFGRKSQTTASPRELVEYYQGAQTAHT
jgi:uncharacterized protein YbaR (Trm112 family)